MNGYSLMTNTLLWWIACNNFTTVLLAMPRAKEFHGMRASGEVMDKFEVEAINEPSCEELRAMWRFSKRQSRAAEITNQIPTYRDPFSYNVWDSYFPRTRSGGGLRMITRTGHPIYGIMTHKPDPFRVQDALARDRAFEDYTRYYGMPLQPYDLPRRGKSAVRFVGGRISLPQTGSFQHLKELIKTERARELHQQRMAEEAAAKLAAAPVNNKEPNRYQTIGHVRDRELQQNIGLSYVIDTDRDQEVKDEQNEKSHARYPGVLVFPNILSPTIRHARGESISSAGQLEVPMDYYIHDGYSPPHRSIYRRNFYRNVSPAARLDCFSSSQEIDAVGGGVLSRSRVSENTYR